MDRAARGSGPHAGPTDGAGRDRVFWVVCAAVVLLPVWLWQQLFFSHAYLALSDLYEYFLPNFLGPHVPWSSAEFGGLPVLADPQVAAWFPVNLLFRGVFGSWSGYIVAAYVVGASGAFAYGWQLTRSVPAAAVMGIAWPLGDAMAARFPHLQMLHGYAWVPWALFAVDRLIAGPSRRWIAIAAGIFTCVGLSGHLQVVVYSTYLVAIYALVAWLFESRRLAALGALAAAGALALLLCAVQFVPSLADADWFARVQVNFGQFAMSFAKQPQELVALLVPQFCYEHREGPMYVGITTVILAALALVGDARGWRTWFWLVVAVVAVMLSLGQESPLAAAAYDLPLYNRFRVVARHLPFASFAIVVLGGFGAALLAAGRVARGRAIGALVAVAVVTGYAVALVRARPDVFPPACGGRGLFWIYGGLLSDTGMQAVIAAAGLVLVLLALVPRLRRGAVIALVLLLGVDLLNVQTDKVTLIGMEPPKLLAAALVGPGVHADALKQAVAPARQRVLPLEGSALDPVVPGTWARLWGLDSLGGYNPLLPSRFNVLTRIGNSGSAPDALLLDPNQVLDLFAVRDVIVRAARLPPDEPVETIDKAPSLDVTLGSTDCQAHDVQRATFGMSAAVDASAVVLDADLGCYDNVRAGHEVATVSVRMADGSVVNAPLTAPLGSQVRIPLPRAGRVERVQIATAPMLAWIRVRHLAVAGPDGRLHPASLPLASLAGVDRWREVRRFQTSRESDRGRDEDVRGEEAFVVFENRRARPRLWLVHDTREVPDALAPDALRSGQTRDGAAFDVATTALVPPGSGLPATVGQGDGVVVPTRVANGDIVARVDSPGGGLLVVSELHHPGWTATIDGQPAPVLRVDYAIMGVRVEPGRHRVELGFRPRSATYGMIISGLALVAFAGLLVTGGLKPSRS